MSGLTSGLPLCLRRGSAPLLAGLSSNACSTVRRAPCCRVVAILLPMLHPFPPPNSTPQSTLQSTSQFNPSITPPPPPPRTPASRWCCATSSAPPARTARTWICAATQRCAAAPCMRVFVAGRALGERERGGTWGAAASHGTWQTGRLRECRPPSYPISPHTQDHVKAENTQHEMQINPTTQPRLPCRSRRASGAA
jgi:hypothetical protein